MIVHGYEYDSDETSADVYQRFYAWAQEALPTQVSAWRTRHETASRWFVIVVDEGEGSLDYDFAPGRRYVPTEEMARALILRRLKGQMEAYLAGAVDRVSTRQHFDAGEQPRLTRDGRWEFPPR